MKKEGRLDQKLTWDIVDRAGEEVLSLPPEKLDQICSVILYGSLIRGDFIPGISDVDILIVFREGCDVDAMKALIGALCAIAEPYKGLTNNPSPIDIAWTFESELPLKGTEVVPFFKCLNIYAFDFVEHSKVIYGDDFRSNLHVRDPRDLASARAQELVERIHKYYEEGKLWMVSVGASEALRTAQLYYGERTIDKRRVLTNFHRYVPSFPLKGFADELWEDYLTPGYLEALNDGQKKAYYERCIRFTEQIAFLLTEESDRGCLRRT